jgi:TPR repeat protein
VPRDDALAYAWFILATERGDENARANRDLTAAELDETARARAESTARELAQRIP